VECFFAKELIFTNCCHTNDTRTAYDIDADGNITAAFSFAVWEAEEHLIGYMFTVIVEKHRRKILSEVCRKTEALWLSGLSKLKVTGYTNCLLLAGMSQETKPH
jgi:hypothetical protein